MKTIIHLCMLATLIACLPSCKKNKTATNTANTGRATGYNSSTENINNIPKAIDTKKFGSNNSSVPSSAFLYNYLPPVGDQGAFGTCIAWSSGYYTKTALEAVANNYSSSDLTNPAKQMSAKDLFSAVPDNLKGATNCDATNFDAALTVLQNRGVATLQTCPYTGLTTCSTSTLDPSWATDAANHKISTYRAITDASVSDYIADVKQNIANKTPVMVGIGVGAGFQNWTGQGVMTSGFDPCGGGNPCGGHAQTIVGYDDSKGNGGAFRVINSWATTWGDNGYYWVDYNFMFNTLIEKDNNGNPVIFVANNGTSNVTPPVSPTNPTSGVDLAAWVQSDVNTGSISNPTRRVYFDVYNIGTSTASASADWGLYYVYYNAYNANDYGIIVYDAFNTTVASNTYSCSGNQCAVNFDLPAGGDVASTVFPPSTITYQDYTMPSITGDYYLILVADAGEVLGDVDYSNNMFYTSDYTTYFSSGYAAKNGGMGGIMPDFNNTETPTRDLLKKSHFNTAVNEAHPNAYTPKEIIGFLKQKKASGELDAKVRASRTNQGSISGK